MSRPQLTKEKFIERAVIRHDSKYSYDNVLIEHRDSKVVINCPTHGDFLQTYRKHLEGRGCRKCASNKHSIFVTAKLSMTPDEWLKRSKLKHGDRYDYSQVTFLNSKTKVNIVCKKHGIFSQEPARHLKNNGCYKCGRETTSEKTRNKHSIFELVKKFNEVHNNKYTYPNLNLDHYSSVNSTIIDFVCPEHGAMKQRLSSHLKGNGCDKCRYFGYSKTRYVDNCIKRGHKTSSYYAIRFYNDSESFIKLGITTQGVKTRYRKIKERGYYKYEILFEVPFDPSEVWDLERKNKSKYVSFKYQPKNEFPGSTECFTMELPIVEIADEMAVTKIQK